MNCSGREIPGLALGKKKKGILSSHKKIVLGFTGEDEGPLVWQCLVCQSHVTMLRPKWRSGLLGVIAIRNIVFLGVTPPQTFAELMGRTVLQRSLQQHHGELLPHQACSPTSSAPGTGPAPADRAGGTEVMFSQAVAITCSSLGVKLVCTASLSQDNF